MVSPSRVGASVALFKSWDFASTSEKPGSRRLAQTLGLTCPFVVPINRRGAYLTCSVLLNTAECT